MPSSHTRLSAVLDAVNDAHFRGEELPARDRHQAASIITSRFALPYAYADTFALCDDERKNGWKLFTGEQVQSAAARHIAGEEACRALLLLNSRDTTAQKALSQATERLLECLERAEANRDHRMGGNPGTFCCGPCTISVWRHLNAGGLDRREERIAGGMKALKRARDPNTGKWRRYPFWYAISALVEMNSPEALRELKQVARSLERAAKSDSDEKYALRRAELARRVLMRI